MMLAVALWLSTSLWASEVSGQSPSILVEVGGTHTFNDPFVSEVGLRIGGELFLSERVRVGAEATLTPSFGTASWTALTTQLIDENRVAPDISNRIWTAHTTLRIVLVETQASRWSSNVSLMGGFGVVHTKDDLSALQTDASDTSATSTEVQTHPTTLLGLAGEVWAGGHLGFRWSLESMAYIETVEGVTLETKRAGRSSGALLWRF